MNELTKTVLFVALAATAVVAAIVGRPGRVGVEAPEQIGKPLFDQFTEPGSAQSLEVVEYDEALNTVQTFEVTKQQGQWVIPSHEDYPADATQNLKVAATLLVGLKVINVAGDQNKDHVTYGVIEPESDQASRTAEGVGKLIKMKDSKGNRLAELIIGKPVKGQEGQRYVRVPGQDRVYTVEIDPESFSTKFEDWIEQDVLQLESMDIARMTIRDYSVTPVVTPDRRLSVEEEQRLQMEVSWNADEFKWNLDELLEYRNGQLRPTELLDNEELDKSRLDEMKNALADLQIVDVSLKPQGLREGLKEDQEDFWSDRGEGVSSLVSRGFYPMPTPEGDIRLVSGDGEVTVITKDAVSYTLRFGQIAGAETEGDQSKLKRFVMLTATVDDASIPRPKLEDLPELPEEKAAADTEGESRQSDSNDSAENDSAESDSAGASKAGGENDSEAAADVASGTEGAATEDTAADIDAERDRIVKENQRKQDEYNEKKKKAQDKVNELNLRFADWYYVISEDVYRQIHLGRPDVIKTKETSVNEGFGIDSLRKLEEEGLKQDEAEQE